MATAHYRGFDIEYTVFGDDSGTVVLTAKDEAAKGIKIGIGAWRSGPNTSEDALLRRVKSSIDEAFNNADRLAT